MPMYPGTAMAMLLLAAGWIGAGCAARAATPTSPGGSHVSSGMPVTIGTNGEGKPTIECRGPGTGSASAGVARVVGSDSHDRPMIAYRGADLGSLRAGVPVILGSNGDGDPQITYLPDVPRVLGTIPTGSAE